MKISPKIDPGTAMIIAPIRTEEGDYSLRLLLSVGTRQLPQMKLI